MRPELAQFLEEILLCHRKSQALINERFLALEGNDWRVCSEAEFVALLHRVTVYLLYGDSVSTDGHTHGLKIIQERLEKVFGAAQRQVVFEAIEGRGLRKSVEQYVDAVQQELVSELLYALIDSYFEIAYGGRLERDYDLMHQDGSEYFEEHRLLLPSSIWEQRDTYIKGSMVVQHPITGQDALRPRMWEVYVRHPEWMNAQRQPLLSR
ncbi:hypothetical protein [Cerasicoccus maritimus]|uniref:hypothetical protein n=1 Tax=Cerasicoccus maritimus TaxID=490089 RepID=UPI00285256DD|nr:hypothetical protein [Cerasicoccus maritimus]